MRRTGLLIVAGLLVSAGTVMARPPAVIVAEIESMELPAYDAERRGDADYRAEYAKLRQEYNEQRASLILELYEEDPGHEQIVKLMPERWQLIQRTDSDAVLEETKTIISQPLASDELQTEAAYWHANVICNTTRYNPDEAMPAIESFMQIAPEDDRAARLILGVANYGTEDPDLQMKIYKRSLQLFPDSQANKYTHGKIRQVESLGKPFELTFTEATSGEQISLQRDLRGKVVVLDFWATWCGPCVAEMPKMKELYAEYSGRGVEFIGISLDQPEDKGGLDKLKAYVEENEVRWPQYYQGNYWDSEFSRDWGVNAIPCVFVVDPQGRLHSVKARGKLEEMIPELLSQRDSG